MIADWSRAVHVSQDEFVVCWNALGLGDLPLALALRPLGASLPERQRLQMLTLTELRHRGLADSAGLVADLAWPMRLLAKAGCQLDIRLMSGAGGAFVGLGALAGADGMLLAGTGGVVRLLALDAARVPAALVELAGPITPGPGRSVNIPADTLDDACQAAGDGNLWTLADRLVARGVASADASSLARMCTGIQSMGQVGATGYRGGFERRAPWVIGFHHTAAGAYLQLRRPSADGRVSVTISPVTAERLLNLLRELVDQLAPG
ncbi:MAG: ESX secretion-associated protein EspG [Pseudonocardia sp.]|nr:ESX secretion-associated protein EspG [Pseudonocardia sp.]